MKPNRATILHIVGGEKDEGGVMHFVKELARAGSDDNYVWKYRGFKDPKDSVRYVCEGKGRHTDMGLVNDLTSASLDFLPLYRWIKNKDRLILHAHNRMGILVGFAVNRMTGQPLIIHLHSLANRPWIYRFLARRSRTFLLFNSRKTCLHYGFNPDRSNIVSPTIKWPEQPASNQAMRPRFVAGGNFVPTKNFHAVIEAFNRISDDCPDFELHIYGVSPQPLDPSYQARIIEQARTNSRVKLLGYDPGWADSLGENDIFVHVGRPESFGIVILQAFARGCRLVLLPDTFIEELTPPQQSAGICRIAQPCANQISEGMKQAAALSFSPKELWQLRRDVQSAFSMETKAKNLSTFYEVVLNSTA